ncbi:MAG: CBS domain-containing protein [Oscillospiraceae bacterium]|jgi:CBS domain-containing protein|nr:CBS domain-containing protein [Oscillospiraceae bacterium]
MKVKDVMSSKVVSVAPGESAAVAARLLARHNVGALPVCTSDGKLRGMLTDRDIVLRCVATDEDPYNVKVSDIMTRRVVSISPKEKAQAATDLMAREQIRRLPVEDNGKIIGMVSLGDFAKRPDYSTEAADALAEISMNMKRL